jgi:mono/diheme cytochrome c family protein
MDTGLRGLVEQAYRARGGKGAELPGAAQISGRGRVDLRFAIDDAGELYILTKPDGMIRKVVGATVSAAPAVTSAGPPTAPGPPATAAGPRPGTTAVGPPSAAMRNPVPSTPASIAAGKTAYDATCSACHGSLAQGAVKAKVTISIIEEQGGKQPPDLTDEQWDHGASDGEIYTVIKRGVPSTMMPGFDSVVSDTDLWNIVNYLRTLAPRK